jgi:hypothetical protein
MNLVQNRSQRKLISFFCLMHYEFLPKEILHFYQMKVLTDVKKRGNPLYNPPIPSCSSSLDQIWHIYFQMFCYKKEEIWLGKEKTFHLYFVLSHMILTLSDGPDHFVHCSSSTSLMENRYFWDVHIEMFLNLNFTLYIFNKFLHQ